MRKKKEKMNFVFKVMLLFLVIGMLAGPDFAFAVDKVAEIDKYISACHQREFINGTVLVAIKGQVIYKKAFGTAHAEWDIPNSIDTKFYLYTTTQQFTAALILKLVEEGKIKLDGTIREYLPYYREDTGKKITIHHLLTHTHGIQDLAYTSLPLVNRFQVKQFVEMFLSKDLEFEPGEKFQFSTFTGYTLLAAIIEQVTGKTYEQVLHEKIFIPLNMKNSGFIHHDAVLKKRASAYLDAVDERRTKFFEFRCNGATSLYATVDDLLLWDRALTGSTLLSEKSKELMFKKHTASSRSGSTGYAWNIVNISSGELTKKIAWQTGGGSVAVWRILDDDILVVFLNNIVSPKLLEMCMGVSNILFNRSPILPKRSFVNSLIKIIAAKGVQAAAAEYNRLRKDHPNEYNFEESELNILGGYLLSRNQIAEAIEIYRLNLQVYPNSWYTFGRLGEALLRGNNKELAIKFFEAAIKLMPRGEEEAYKHITKRLKQLKEEKKPEEKK